MKKQQYKKKGKKIPGTPGRITNEEKAKNSITWQELCK